MMTIQELQKPVSDREIASVLDTLHATPELQTEQNIVRRMAFELDKRRKDGESKCGKQ